MLSCDGFFRVGIFTPPVDALPPPAPVLPLLAAAAA
jgi:hypothetical protein